jgi:hypothetical protein
MEQKPQIVFENPEGWHNTNKDTTERLLKSKSYQDLSTICIIPCPVRVHEKQGDKVIELTLNGIHPKVVQSWMGMMTPMNQKFIRVFALNMEVGAAYSSTIEAILANPELSKWKYILTMEWDNMPPPDGLLKLYEGMDKYDVVGGLYWTKGPGGVAMAYGDPNVMPLNFVPQIPKPDTLQRVNGLGMGYTLFRLDIFKDPRLKKPFFETIQEHIPYTGTRAYTQDLAWFEKAGALGYKFACNTSCKIGHFDPIEEIVW